jgi:hypothetical protein
MRDERGERNNDKGREEKEGRDKEFETFLEP